MQQCKGVIKINNTRRNFTTTIDLNLQRQFKSKCAEKGIKMNDLLEAIMKMLVQEKIDFSNSEVIISKK
jgi:predicted RNase H-like nuclease